MVVNNVVHVNEHGLPLNAIDWLIKHHECKIRERRQMIRDLGLQEGNFIVDAGCGPGLWTPLLAEAIGERGNILGVDISVESLVMAQRRSYNTKYRHQIHYKHASLEQLPLEPGTVDCIFSANVSQYLPDPVATFAAMGPCLQKGGRLIIKDIDFGTMHFGGIDSALQARILQGRKRWEQERTSRGYAYEDSWIGSKLASYLSEAGFQGIEERPYRIVRAYPLHRDYRFYLQGIAEWFVGEENPYLDKNDVADWLCYFSDPEKCILHDKDFMYEETEYVVSGVWNGTPSSFYLDMTFEVPSDC